MDKAPFSRGSKFVDMAMRKHAEWLALQDIPETIVRSVTATATRCGGGSMTRKENSGSGGVSPTTLTPVVKKAVQKLAMTSSSGSVSNSNLNSSLQMPRVLRRPPSGDDIFMMDDNEPQATATTLDVPPMSLPMSVAPQASPPVWKAHGVPRCISFLLLLGYVYQSQYWFAESI